MIDFGCISLSRCWVLVCAGARSSVFCLLFIVVITFLGGRLLSSFAVWLD